MQKYLISVIIPLYEEGESLHENIFEIHKVLDDNKINHEFILVDDGSKDDTWIIINKLAKVIPLLKALRLSRNFGKEAAICAGLEIAAGEACVVMDGDLQHPPQIIPQMIKLWLEEGYYIVEGVKISRGKERLINKISSKCFYYIMEKITGFNIKNSTDFKLLDRSVINVWKSMPENNTFFRGMIDWVGFKRISIPFNVVDRVQGKSKWSIIKLFKLAINAITSFSSLPLHIVTVLGAIFFLLAIPISINALVSKFSGGVVDGVTTIILLLLIIGGCIMFSLGIIGTYIAKIFEEVKHRPRYILSEKIESSNSGERDFKIV